MRNCLEKGCLFALLLACLLGVAEPAVAAEKANQISMNASTREDRDGASLSYLHAFSGSLGKEGPLIRIGLSAGAEDSNDSNLSVDLLAGWQSYYEDWRIRALGGVVYRDRSDDGNRDGTGLKFMIQANNKRSSPTYINAVASYDTDSERMFSRLQVGRHFWGKTLGPEAGLLWSSDARRVNVGLFLTGVKVGDASLSFRAGYSFSDNERVDEDTPYLGMSATFQF